jgi:hypothetical protein
MTSVVAGGSFLTVGFFNYHKSASKTSSETSGVMQQYTRRHNPEYCKHQSVRVG